MVADEVRMRVRDPDEEVKLAGAARLTVCARNQ